MSSSLSAALEPRFGDGARTAVLVLGAGLHFQLARRTTLLASWDELIRRLERECGATRHQSPSATFESAICHRVESHRVPAWKAEQQMLRTVATWLKQACVDDLHPARLKRLGAKLRQRGFRDVISLNLDDALTLALRAAGGRPGRLGSGSKRSGLTRLLRNNADTRLPRLWFPHGHVTKPAQQILGLRSYGVSIARLDAAFRAYKTAERRHALAHGAGQRFDEFLRSPSPASRPLRAGLSWPALIMQAPLIFVGTSLDPAETDLWWALHQRQRNLARVSPAKRPATVLVAQHGTLGSHLKPSAPAGLEVVTFASWDQVWDEVLGGSLK